MSRADEMAIGGATLVGLAALQNRGGGSPGPGPGPVPTPIPGNQGVNDASGDVTPSGRILFGPNANRTLVSIVNDGDDTVYICLSDAPTIHTGIRINSGGGWVALELGDYYGVISAIALSATTNVCAVEVYNK